MHVQAIQNCSSVKPNFCSKPSNQDNNKPETPQKGYSGKQISGAVIAAALSAAALGGAVMHGRGQKVIRQLSSENSTLQRGMNKLEGVVNEGKLQISRLTDDNTALTKSNKSLAETNNGLRTMNEGLKKTNNALQAEVQRVKDRFQDLFEGDLAPKDVRDRIYSQLKGKIDGGKLNYDISTPPVTGKGQAPVYTDAIPMPTAGTLNRASMRGITLPEIAADGSFSYKMPSSPEVKISHMPTKDFKPISHQATNILEDYADSVQWNNDKIARDVLQNFFDGHGQTLDGVGLKFTPMGNGKYKVRIEGDSTYTANHAIFLGDSTKRGDTKAAGNYGEGLKMSVLKLLKDAGAQDVKIASDNWKLTYTLDKSDLTDKRVLAYTLDKAEKLNGNYIEFDTSDKDLLETLRTSVNRFYHSNNTHFKCPDFENEVLGIKKLAPGENGGIYIAGQRFEFDDKYDGLKDFVIFLKEKPPVNILDPSRDRISLNTSKLESIAQWLAQDARMSVADRAKMLTSLESCWDKKGYASRTPMDNFVNTFLRYSNWSSSSNKPLHMKFPDNYVAYSNASDDVVRDLRMNGYKVCKEGFNELGMQTITDLMGDARAHEVVLPNEVQTKKILILKEAINNLGLSLKGKHFTPEELNTKVYLFNNKNPKDSKLYSDTLAEAIIDKGESKGFWIDKEYLDKSSFNDVLETALHELSHKIGGDESAAFSYKLTDVNRDAINQILNDAQSRNELQALNRLWSELTTSVQEAN